MKKSLDKADSQIVLYAKHHFKRPPELLIPDLKVLIGLRCAIDNEFVSEQDIVVVLTNIATELDLTKKMTEAPFIIDVLFGSIFETPVTRYIKGIMSLLANLQIMDRKSVTDEWTPLIHLEPKDESIFAEAKIG